MIQNWIPNVLLKAAWTVFFSAFQRLEISVCSHPPLSVVWVCSKTPNGCLKSQTVLNPIYTKFFLYIYAYGGLVTKSCLTLVTPWTVVC